MQTLFRFFSKKDLFAVEDKYDPDFFLSYLNTNFIFWLYICDYNELQIEKVISRFLFFIYDRKQVVWNKKKLTQMYYSVEEHYKKITENEIDKMTIINTVLFNAYLLEDAEYSLNPREINHQTLHFNTVWFGLEQLHGVRDFYVQYPPFFTEENGSIAFTPTMCGDALMEYTKCWSYRKKYLKQDYLKNYIAFLEEICLEEMIDPSELMGNINHCYLRYLNGKKHLALLQHTGGSLHMNRKQINKFLRH